MSESIESYLDNMFAKAAKEEFNRTKFSLNHRKCHLIYNYKILKNTSRCGLATKIDSCGRCIVTNIYYSKAEDCNIYSIKDIETGEYYSTNQFMIRLHEAEGCYYSEDIYAN